jgi:hypothetical protein
MSLLLRSCFVFCDAGVGLFEGLCGSLVGNRIFRESFVVGYFEALPSLTSLHSPASGGIDQVAFECVDRMGLFVDSCLSGELSEAIAVRCLNLVFVYLDET